MAGMTRRAHLLVLLAALAPTLAAGRADAQAAEQAPVFVPPALLEYVKADYPPEALAQGLEAAVPARLDVDENGLVTAVEILAPAGSGFDEAARDAYDCVRSRCARLSRKEHREAYLSNIYECQKIIDIAADRLSLTRPLRSLAPPAPTDDDNDG